MLDPLLRQLRTLKPDRLDISGWPAEPHPALNETLKLADSCYPETPFPPMGFWHSRTARVQHWWERVKLIAKYDVIISKPGPYIARHDRRWQYALGDISIARRMGRKAILANHSIGPLDQAALKTLRMANLVIAREEATAEYLSSHGCDYVLGADPAFLYEFKDIDCEETSDVGGKSLVFLRHNNLDIGEIELERGGLRLESQWLVPPNSEPLVLASSDPSKDRKHLTALAKRIGCATLELNTTHVMMSAIRHADRVITDRYHPAICSLIAGTNVTVIENQEQHKMSGLKSMAEQTPLEELRQRAHKGMEALLSTITT